MPDKKTAVVSGANGFIGSHVHQYLSKIGWNVLRAGRGKEDVIYFDLSNPTDFANSVVDFDVDVFVHVAAAHEVVCNENPYDAMSYNVLGTKAALDFSVKNSISSFIYISTFHVYGNPKGNICEDDIPLPANEYGFSHYISEQYLEMYQRNKSLKCISLRPTNVYGVPVNFRKFNRWTLIPYAFCKQAVEDRKIVLNTTGEQLRDFVSVLDLCSVIEKITITGKVDSPIHVHGDQVMAISTFALLVKKTMWDDYGISIDVIIGKNSVNSNKFNFMSNCLSKYISKENTWPVEKFISELCGMLLSDNS